MTSRYKIYTSTRGQLNRRAAQPVDIYNLQLVYLHLASDIYDFMRAQIFSSRETFSRLKLLVVIDC